MKQGKRPKKRQKKLMVLAGIDPASWLVVKNLPDCLHLENRITGQAQVLKVSR